MYCSENSCKIAIVSGNVRIFNKENLSVKNRVKTTLAGFLKQLALVFGLYRDLNIWGIVNWFEIYLGYFGWSYLFDIGPRILRKTQNQSAKPITKIEFAKTSSEIYHPNMKYYILITVLHIKSDNAEVKTSYSSL